MRHSVALSSALQEQLASHLLQHMATTRDEDLCFALWHPSYGATRQTALLHTAVLPKYGDREIHGNVAFTPSYLERAIDEAMHHGAGIALLHCHPCGGWQAMSADDVTAEHSIAGAVYSATGLPLVGLTIGTDEAWSARVWSRTAPGRFEHTCCESVRVVGDGLRITYDESQLPVPAFRAELSRTTSAWGAAKQADLARVHCGIIGAGSVGSIVAESLARSGIQRITSLDFDVVEDVNLDRLLNATRMDAILGRQKIKVLGRSLRRSSTAESPDHILLDYSVVEEQGYRAALDCDVLFSCVDRPWPRSILNFIAFAHLIPVIDGGISIRALASGKGIHRADMKAHVAAPGRRCMECLQQYDPGDVATERDGYLDDPTYIKGLSDDHPAKHNENVFGFSVAAAGFEIMQFLSLVLSPLGMGNQGAETYHFVGAIHQTSLMGCNDNCLFPGLTARGDSSGLKLTARHIAAERMRSKIGPRRFMRAGEKLWLALVHAVRCAIKLHLSGKRQHLADHRLCHGRAHPDV